MSPIAVTGMHRTGTSMIAKTLRLAGVHLGDDDEMVEPAPDNPEGFFEHAGFVRLNDDLLEATGGAWDHPPACGPIAAEDPRVVELGVPAHELVAAFAAREPWGWKDPRTCLTASFWLDVVPDLRFIVCVRHPLEVALSLKRRNQVSYALGLSLWQRYYESLLEVVTEDRRMVTHYDAHFDDIDAELERIAGFAGVPPEAVRTARRARDPRLRHHRMELSLADARATQPMIDLYRQLCDEAGRQGESDAPSRGTSVARAVVDLAAANDHLEKRGRHVATLERERDELARRVESLESTAEQAPVIAGVYSRLDGLELAVHDLRYQEEHLEDRSDATMIGECRRLVRECVPSRDAVLVVAKGDAALLDLYGRPASNFPQDQDGLYPGFPFGASSSAIAHLEALRQHGHRHLLVPDSGSWWLDRFAGFGDHLVHRYDVTSVPGVGLLADLRVRRPRTDTRGTDTWPSSLAEVIERIVITCGRPPAILDWTSSAIGRHLPGRSVFEPPDDGDGLPYLDASVDVVVVDEPAHVAEARRAAAVAVITTTLDGHGHVTVTDVDLVAREVASSQEPRTRMVVGTDELDDERRARLYEAVANEPWIEVVCTTDPGAITAAAAECDTVVLVEDGVLPLPGCLSVACSTLATDRVGAVGVKLFGADGALESAGVTMFGDGTNASVATGSHDVAAAWHDYVRDTCWSPGLLVLDAEVVQKLDRPEVPAAAAHAAWSAQVWAAGFRVLYQPDAAAVRAFPGGDVDDDARAAVEREWERSLPSRPPRPPILDETSWRAVLAHDDVEASWQ